MKSTQHQKVIDLCRDGRWVCQNSFRDAFIFSPHKRRVEIEGRKNRKEPVQGKYEFLERKCEHGIGGQKDYRMIENPNYLMERENMYEHSQIKILRTPPIPQITITYRKLPAPYKEKPVEAQQKLF